MNIFEDLIEELKDDNLLETTVVENNRAKTAAAAEKKIAGESDSPLQLSEADMVTETAAESGKNAEAEFHRKRAKNEVAFLHMVEYVFAGVEREQLKIVPQPYNDLRVRQVLHLFLQTVGDAESPERAGTQFQLLQETESWHSSLALRDGQILTGHLRRFCETSRPPLGSPALISLARFYRNSSFSEAVRSKFDLIVTRLFSKEADGNRRETLFTSEELSRQLAGLYADWSSAALYPTESDDPKILEIVEGFAAFAREADDATGFDELIDGDFFNRLYKFKESARENFFAPPAAAAAVESNVRIGNRYVELLEAEKQTGGAVNLTGKYGFSHDQTVSEATGKTLALIELLNQKAAAAPPPPPIAKPTVSKNEPPPPSRKKTAAPPAEQTAEPNDAPASKNRLIVLGAATGVLFLLIFYMFIG